MTTPNTDTAIDGTAKEIPAGTATIEPATPKTRRPRRGLVVGALAIPLALGAVGLSLAQKGEASLDPIAPVAISALAPSGAVAAKGEVAEIFGNKLIIQDGTGRALVETGRQGEGGTLAKTGETITVQGRFENGFLHARLLTHGDGSVVRLGPAGGPPPGGLDWARDTIGLGPQADVPALTKSVEAAGYTDIRVAGRGPRHLDVAAKGADGRERLLHVGFDGKVREVKAY